MQKHEEKVTLQLGLEITDFTQIQQQLLRTSERFARLAEFANLTDRQQITALRMTDAPPKK